jgi:CIC family chloride channel protein
MAISALASLFFLKIAATSLTLGSGGSGGIFAPSLFIGAMLGTAISSIFGLLYPSLTAPAGAYGIVGMAAVFAGAARAPFTAIIIIFEMTGDYNIILPLMTSVVISTIVSRAIRRENIYTLKLLRRGVDIEREERADIMRTVTVKEAMTRGFPTVPPTMKIDKLIKLFRDTGHHGFPVTDEEGILIGVIVESGLAQYLESNPEKERPTVGDVATRHPFVAYPDQTLDRLLDAVDETEGRIPVVSRGGKQRLLGVLGRHEIINIYRRRTRRRQSQTVKQ